MKLYSSKEERDFIIALAVRSKWSGKPLRSAGEAVALASKILVMVEGRSAILAHLDELSWMMAKEAFSAVPHFVLEGGRLVTVPLWDAVLPIQRETWISLCRRELVAACAAQAEMAA